ncbi:YadA-like family protein [Actinobacillus equuli]|uniref:YadA-like family protein n=1 Tax=Actinobacillus equuli TaxID=718 RepID=UPI002446677C|nr:YadA-like family protein [Actinobacillus equuli]WGE82667.1 YadA-like family protein [Actinobacillus equuli subsp. equuli]
MNHIYKVVWSTVTNSLVVVSELARSKGKAASTVSDVKDVSNKTAAVAVAAALQVAAVGTIAIGSFAPMEANAIIAISHVEGGVVQSNTASANASTAGGRYNAQTIDEGTRAYNYYNPGNPGDGSNLYNQSKYVHGIAIGCHTDAIATTGKGGSNGIAIGDYSEATGGLSISLGSLATSRDVGAVAIGTAAHAAGFNSLAMMRQSAAIGNYSTAIGSVSYAKGEASVALGASATAHGAQSIAIGSVNPKTTKGTTDEAFRTTYDGENSTETYGDRSMALGSGAKTNGNDSFAVGSAAKTGGFDRKINALGQGRNDVVATAESADKAIAFGNDSEALKDKAVAFGNNASSKGEEAVAFGFNATSVGNQSVAIGTNSNAAHDRVVTIGTNSTATHNRSMAIGEQAKALENHSLALGANAIVTVENSVSLGADSNADEIGGSGQMQINGKTYTFAGGQAQGTVSVGSGYDKDQARAGTVVRTITDLGAGRVLANSTDAINGSQLYAVVTEINKGWNVTTGAVNGGVSTNASNARVINGETVKVIAGKNVSIDQQDQNITIATKDDVTFTNVKSGNVDATTVKAGDLTVTGKTQLGNLEVKGGSTIDMGGNRVTNIGAPQNANDATTKQYVDDGRTKLESTDGSVTFKKTPTNGNNVYDLSVNADLHYTADNGKGSNKLSAPVKFAGVKGETATTAVDGQVTVGLAKEATDSLKKADSAMQDFTVGADSQHKAEGIKVNQTTNRFDIIGTEGYVNTTVTDGSVKVDIAKDFRDAVSNNTKNIADNKQNITNNANNITKNTQDIAKGFGLKDQNGGVVNKALGEKIEVVGGNKNIETKVEGEQLKINLNNTLDLTAGGSVQTGDTKVDNNGLTIANGPSVTKTGINAGNQKITKVQDGDVSENSTDAVNGSQLHKTNQNVTKNATDIKNVTDTVNAGWELRVEGTKAKDVTPTSKVANFKAGDNIDVSIADDKSVVIATKKDVTFDNVTAKNGLTVNKNATIDMGDNVINGVANGEVSSTSKQAVNGSQLYQTNQNVTNLANVVDGGFGLKAQNGATVDKKLGEKAEIIGGNKNINTTVTNDGKLAINLNNTLDLGDKGSVTTGNTTVNNDGVTIKAAPGKTEVSLTNKGLNNGGNTITNVAAGVNKTDAVNVEQLDKVNATANAGWVLQANKDKATESTVKPNQTVSLNNTDNNIVITKKAGDNNITFGLNNTITVGDKTKGGNNPVTIDGTKGTVNGLTNTTFDPNKIVSGQAATEDQLKQVNDNVNTNINNVNNDLTKKGLNFVGDNKGEVVHRDLGATLSVVGGAEENNLSDKNIGVIGNQDGSLTVKLAKTLKDLTSATFTNGADNNGNTVIDGKGVTITPSTGDKAKTVSLTNNGLNNGGNTITNVAAGKDATDAVNVSQLEKVNATAKAGWNLAVNDEAKGSNIAPNATVRLNNKDGNIKVTKEGNNVTFDLNNTVTIGPKGGAKNVVINGNEGTVTGLTNKEFTPGKIVSGRAATEDQLQSSHNQLNTNITNLGTELTNKGLSFVGDNDTVKVHRKLGETLSVIGGAEQSKLTDKNIGVIGSEGKLEIKLAKELTDLTSANFTGKGANTTINGNGVTITPNGNDATKTVSLTDKGLNNGNNTITNVARGEKGTDAVNVDQLKEVSSAANAGWNISANGANSTNVGPKGKVSLNNTDGNIVITKDTKDNNVTFNLSNDLTIGGKDGKDGQIGVSGKDGKTGVTLNGKDGSIGLTGAAGKDGKNATANITVANGKDGLDGKNGANGKTRIVYETKTPDGNSTTEEVATLNDGLNFIGNQGEKIAKKLNDTLTVKGTLANNAAASSENVRVDSQDGALVVKLAQNLANLTTATFGNTATDKTVVGKDGVTISGTDAAKTVSLTDKGLNNGNNIITNVSSGLVGNDGTTKVALKDANGTTLTNAVNVGDLKDTVKELTNATTGGFGLKDSTGKEVKQDLGTSIKVTGKDGVNAQVVTDGNGKALQIGLNSTVTVGKDNEPGVITVKGENGKDGVTINGKDGTIGLNGKDGANGSITVKNGQPGVDGKPGETKTRIVYNTTTPDGKTTTEEVATLNDGLNFVGDKGGVIAKPLNKTLTIKGNLDVNANVTDKNLRVDNDNGELIIKMAKVLTDLTSANFTDAAGNNTIIGGNGVTITPNGKDATKTVSLTDKGLNNGNNQITNVTSGLTDATGNKADLTNAVDTNAVNVGDLKETVKNITTDGFGLKDDKGTEVKQDLGKTIQIKGKDGVTVTSNVTDKSLEVALAGDVVVNGKDGKDGTIGVKGADGKDGTTITKDAIVFNGVDGVNGKDGKDGADGKASIKVEKGAKGIDGNDGKDGESKTRIVYEKPNGEKEEVATLNDGLNFVGNDGKVVAKKLNKTLAITGGINTEAGLTAASDRNVGVRKNNDGLNIVIAERPTFSGIIVDGKDGKDAEVKFAKDGKDGMSIVGTRGADGQNGLTLKGADGKDGVSFKEDGRITNVADGKDGKDAVNKDQLERVNATANAGWKLTINNGNNQTTVTPNATVDLANTDGNIVITKAGNNVNFGLNNTLTVGNDNKPGTMTVKGENGKDGVSISGKDGISIKGENGQDAVSINGKDGNGAIAVNGKDGKTGVGLDGANGTIGINGKDGSNGAITVEKGAVGVDGTDGANGKDGMTRIVYTDANGTKHNVSTLNDGLSFVGDTGNPIAKKLNQTLTIKGNLDAAAAVTDKNLRVDNVDGALIIKMARTLTDLTSATFTNAGGDKSVVDGNGLTITPANGGNTVSLTTKGLDNGGNKVINVADGDVSATSTDAVNGSQLYAVSEVANKGWNIQTNGNASTNVKPGDTVNFANGDNIKINNDGTKVTVGLVEDVDLGKDGSIKAGDTIMDNEGVKVGDKVSLMKDGLTAGDVKISAETGINAGNKQITNVESGLGGTKLADAKGDTLKNAANIGDLQTAISGVTDAEQGGGFGLADDNGTEVKQSLGKTIQVKGDGNVTTTVTNGSLTVGLNKDVDLGKDGSLTAGGTKVSEKGVSFADSLVNLTSDGLNNGGNKVTNVKAGEVSATSTDAVNGSQLHATNQNVTNVQNTVAKGWNIEAGTVEGSTGKVTGASKSKVAMGDTVGMKAGNNIEITQDGSNIAIATSATPTFDTVTVGKDGNTATVGTVKDKHGSAIKVTGADGKSETRINNVADGKADNDAVNVRQLKGVAQNVANIDNRVSKLDKRVRGIGANSAAASSLPQVMLPGKSMVAVAGGAYSGASAVAVGYSRASDNGKVILKVNGTANSAGHYSGGVGVGFQW